MKKEKSCGAVIYKYENNKLYILLVKHNKGHWGSPKGHIEDFETEEETALREIKEETNLDVILDNKFRHVITYSPSEDTIKDVVYFIATPKTNEVKPQEAEIAEIKWYELSEALKIVSYENDRKILISAIEYLSK